MTSEYEARQVIKDTRARVELYKWLWSLGERQDGKLPPLPAPLNVTDEDVIKYIHRTLGIKSAAHYGMTSFAIGVLVGVLWAVIMAALLWIML